MRNFDNIRPPPPSFGDVINMVQMLPDILHIYTTEVYLGIYRLLQLEAKVDRITYMVACFTVQTMLLVMLVRCLPRIVGIPLTAALLITSLTNSCGLLLLMYVVFDTGRWLFLGARRVSVYTAPMAETRKEAWWTKELNGLIMLLVVMSFGGCYFGFFQTEVMYVCYMVVVILTFSTAFPTNGQNAGMNSLIIMAASMVIILFITGAGERLLGVLGDFARKTEEARKEKVVHEVQTDAWAELASAIGDWQSTLFLSHFHLDITRPMDCFRYVIGSSYLLSLVMGNLLGPTSCVRAAAMLQFRLNDKSRISDGLNSIFTSRWNNAVIFTVVATAVRGSWFCTGLGAIGALLAVVYYHFLERRTWAGVGEFTSVKSGREDADLIVGEGPGRLRVFTLQAIIMILTITHPGIHPLVLGVMAVFVYMKDHRVLCFMAAILTQNYGFLAGVFCTSTTTLTDDLRSREAPAWSGGDLVHGHNSEKETITNKWNSLKDLVKGKFKDWLPRDEEYWNDTLVRDDTKPP